MMKPIAITTSRLLLRRALEHDAELLYQNYCSNSKSSKFLTRLPHQTIEQTRTFLTKWCKKAWLEKQNYFAWVIALKSTDEAIGVFLVEHEGDTAQIHYGISGKYEGQGLISEAGHAVISWLSQHANIKHIWTICDLENFGSITVLEKWGFEQKEILKKYLLLPAFSSYLKRDCYKYVWQFQKK